MRRLRGAFTVVELLVAITIVALLCALVVGVTMRAKDGARHTTCAQSLHQIGLAISIYVDSYDILPRLNLDPVIQEGLLPSSLLLCRQDSLEGFGSKAWACVSPALRNTLHPTTYETPLHFQQTRVWKALQDADPNHGMVVCRVHGNKTEAFNVGAQFCDWAMMAYEGKLLRLRKDGSLQHAKLSFIRSGNLTHFSSWRLWTDEPEPEWWPGID